MNNRIMIGILGASLVITPLYVTIHKLYKLTQEPQIKEWYNESMTTAKDTLKEIEEDDLTSFIDVSLYKDLIGSWENTSELLMNELEKEYGNNK